jgi:hypothetical protein
MDWCQGAMMKVGPHDGRNVKVALVLLCTLFAGCASSALADESRKGESGRSEKAQTKTACPSQDFTSFLQRYADSTDDSVRLRFTEDPLEYEVPTHTVEDETATSPPTHVSGHGGASRLNLFPYRYFRETKAFGRIDPYGDQRVRQGGPSYPMAITIAPEDGREVAFGMEYEVDTYLFKRSQGCWYLTRAINLRD